MVGYIGGLVILRVINCTSATYHIVGYVIVVTWARGICLICMPEARGHTYQANHERPRYKYYVSLPAL